MCCVEGWEKLQGSISHMFSHAITLEILNQTLDKNMYDYIELGKWANKSPDEDAKIADEIKKAEEIYCSYIGDYKEFDKISFQQGVSRTEEAIRHLYKCVEAQFMSTDRKRANQFYNEKFSEFCKDRWVKNRRKSGLVLNLTESDVIFLTKICLRNAEKIRLNDLYKEYECRGIYLDSTSKEYLQEFFAKLNLIDKKSDSGDAQYVKRIL
jgi:DNA phosphorothioation-dependent restriction protein DptG